ncbi:MAG: hypothetical protein JNL34_06540 [Anaerolineae bacterium]|nr:hypothetical protein [Anaerolineae bacterium]
MTTEGIVLLVVGVLGLIVAVLLAVRWLTSRRLKAIWQRFPNAQRAAQANFYGQESKGKGQLRGSGVLVLLPDQLLFEMLAPRRQHAIPRNHIIRTESPSAYLGKTNFRPLLKVVFQGETGKLDSMAWLVQDVPAWQAQISVPPPVQQ